MVDELGDAFYVAGRVAVVGVADPDGFSGVFPGFLQVAVYGLAGLVGCVQVQVFNEGEGCGQWGEGVEGGVESGEEQVVGLEQMCVVGSCDEQAEVTGWAGWSGVRHGDLESVMTGAFQGGKDDFCVLGCTGSVEGVNGSQDALESTFEGLDSGMDEVDQVVDVEGLRVQEICEELLCDLY